MTTADGYDYSDAEWVSGWVALRKLNDPKRAIAHFTKFRSSVETPISLGRGGYWLGRAYWGQGYASEAAMALVGDTFTRFEVPALKGGTYDGNPASDRILEKIGFERTERFHDDASLGRDEPASGWEWRLTRADWEAMDRP